MQGKKQHCKVGTFNPLSIPGCNWPFVMCSPCLLQTCNVTLWGCWPTLHDQHVKPSSSCEGLCPAYLNLLATKLSTFSFILVIKKSFNAIIQSHLLQFTTYLLQWARAALPNIYKITQQSLFALRVLKAIKECFQERRVLLKWRRPGHLQLVVASRWLNWSNKYMT